MDRLTTRGESNTKTAKRAAELGIRNLILHLAPHTNAGIRTASGRLLSVCPSATTGCAAACLYTAGLAKRWSSINQARIARTRWFHEDRPGFMGALVREIAALERAARREGTRPAARLNGTSDVAWEAIPCERGGVTFRNLMEAFPEVTFYDYTKVAARLRRAVPPNYHLTFSLAEDNDAHAAEALGKGVNVAAVLRVMRTRPLPETWSGWPVVDGDTDDFRFLDPSGVIVGLRPKGDAHRDTSGFVRDPDDVLDTARRPTYASAA